mgnify:CR=1 FL=1
MNYIGIDLGTSSVKLVLMDTAGHIIANVSKSYPIDYHKAGWSEQNPYDWYDACMEGMKELLDGQDESTVGGISFGGQMHGLVILDKDDQVIRPAILWNDGNCYLYAYEEEKARFSHFRIDRMEDIRLLALPRVGKDEYKEKDLTARQPKIFNMFSGEECLVKLRCINRLADVMLDRFGREIILTPDDEAHFLVNVPVELSPPFYAWIASFGRQVKILSPEKVVNGMRDFLQKSMDMYKNDGKM